MGQEAVEDSWAELQPVNGAFLTPCIKATCVGLSLCPQVIVLPWGSVLALSFCVVGLCSALEDGDANQGCFPHPQTAIT